MGVSTHKKTSPVQTHVLVIPTFNCESQIGGLINALHSVTKNWDAIWVIDNGSTDGTLEETKKSLFALSASVEKFRLFQNSKNIGLGGTQKVAIKRAIEDNYGTITIFHGDHQARLEDAVSALDFIKSHPETFVMGSRFLRNSKLVGYSKTRLLFNLNMNLLYSVLLKQRVYDLGSGLNIFPLSQLSDFESDKLPSDLTFNIEFLKWLIKNKKKISWLPINWIEEDQISNVKVLSQTIKTLALAFIPFGKMGSLLNSDTYQNEIQIHV
jgi:glycosyltransferase involved in cell wall biosynthesis